MGGSLRLSRGCPLMTQSCPSELLDKGRGGVPKAKLGTTPNDPLLRITTQRGGIGVGGGPRSHHPSPPSSSSTSVLHHWLSSRYALGTPN
eukprot:9167252-Karenia_brevis.AAC.1